MLLMMLLLSMLMVLMLLMLMVMLMMLLLMTVLVMFLRKDVDAVVEDYVNDCMISHAPATARPGVFRDRGR